MEIRCKKCFSDKKTKSGKVRNKQRYRCKLCGCNYTNSEAKRGPKGVSPLTRHMILALYSTGRTSMCFIAKLTGLSTAGVMKIIRREGEKLEIPAPTGKVTEIEIDEMWHFIEKKIKNMALESH